MGTSERREREKQEQRTRILDAARELFAAEGYDAVTMRKIAERIEYSPTAIYAHFKDKSTLIHELCHNDFHVFAQRFAELLTIEDPVERLKRGGKVYVDFAIEQPQHYRLLFLTPRPAFEHEDTEGKDDPGQSAYAFLRVTLEEAMKKGLLRPELTNLDLVAQTVWAALHGVIALHITVCDEQEKWMQWAPLAERRALMSDVVMRGILKG